MVSPENNSNALLWIGGVVFVAGVLVMTGYGVYEFGREFFGHSDVPIAIQIALPATVIGLAVLLAAVVKDRMKNRKDENLKEVKY
jgi:hypothetical protein